MDYKKEIISAICSIAGRYSAYEVFGDWVKMLSLSISNQIDSRFYQKRELDYMDIARKYSSSELKKICDISGMLTLVMEEEMTDVLGYIYQHLGMNSKQLGQFFTPYHVCRLMAQTIDIDYSEIDKKGYIEVNEPTCGAGANIIAFAERMKSDGYNYQTQLSVVCQDLDWKAVYMCYVQLSLYGIPAYVVQGDTLIYPYNGRHTEHVFITPMKMLNGHMLMNI